jgi:outer membrane protein assembly factor BamA
MANIELGAMSDTIAKQLHDQGVEQIGKSVELLDRMANAITILYLHGCLTDSETDKARKKLVKQIKVRPLTANVELRGCAAFAQSLLSVGLGIYVQTSHGFAIGALQAASRPRASLPLNQ